MISLENINTESKKQLNKIGEIEKYIDKLKKEFNTSFKDIAKSLNEHKISIKEPDLQVAIVGTIKAGKSTFINAFLRENIASTEVTPETASLTKFKYSESNNLTIRFYKQNEWDELWDSVNNSDSDIDKNVFKKEYTNSNADSIKNDYINREELHINCKDISELTEKVREYTSKNSVKHYFVKEIIVGVNNNRLPKEVIFVDTPGLNDVVSYRSNITKEYIKKANAVIVCVEASSLTSDESITIVKIFENVGKDVYKVLILGTQLDKLNNPKSDWEKQRKEWGKYFIGKYEDENIMNNNVLGVSSFVDIHISEIEKRNSIEENTIYTIKKFSNSFGINLEIDESKLDKTQDSFNKALLSAIKENIGNIRDKTNISNINKILENNILSKRIEIIINDLKKRYSNIIVDIGNKLSAIAYENNEMKESLDMSKKEKEEYILEKKKEIEKLIESKSEINKSFSELKSKWLELNNDIKKK